MKIQFQISGPPKHQQRHRSSSRGKFIHQYDPSAKDKKDFLLQARKYAPKSPIVGAIKLNVWFCMSRPKNHYRTGKYAGILKDKYKEVVWHTKTPDIDNCIKFLADALNGVFWRDDSQICSIIAQKLYAEKPRTVIIINY